MIAREIWSPDPTQRGQLKRSPGYPGASIAINNQRVQLRQTKKTARYFDRAASDLDAGNAA
jgi:hypothetical protein